MNGFIKRSEFACLILLAAFLASQSNCLATVIHTDGYNGSHSDDFNSDLPIWPTWTGIDATAYVTPPNIDPSPTNLYGRSGDGHALFYLMDEPWGDNYLHLRVTFDWVYLGGTRMSVTTSGMVDSYTTSTLFSELASAPPENISIPETKRFSFDVTLTKNFWYMGFSMNFLAVDALEQPVPFGLDNFKVWSVPEPVVGAYLLSSVALGWLSFRRRTQLERVGHSSVNKYCHHMTFPATGSRI